MNEDQTFYEVHTAECPYCGNFPCWCHDDADYHSVVITPFPLSEQDTHELYRVFGLEVAQ